MSGGRTRTTTTGRTDSMSDDESSRAAAAAATATSSPTAAQPATLIPNLDEAHVEIMKQGWLYKQGGAKGGRKNWKRRWFELKEGCLYYKESPESVVLLGVMPLHGCHILDLGGLTQGAPPVFNETQTLCHECKKPFTFMDRKHHCRHCGNTYCNSDSSKRIAIPKFGFNSKVRVCDACYDIILTEMESSEVVRKLMELTGERPRDAAVDAGVKATPTAIAAHAQAMNQIKQRAAGQDDKAGRGKRRSSVHNLLTASNEDPKKRFTLPSVNKPHLFAIKNSERELWLHAEAAETRRDWVQAVRDIQRKKTTKDGKGGDAASPKANMPSWEINYNKLTVLNMVGVGAFGEVYRARLWGTEVAMKTLKMQAFKDSQTLLEELKKEVSIISQLRHPNVVLYIGACTMPPNVCILTEWCSRGSLYDVLHDFSVHIDAKLSIEIAMGIAQGMNYLHSLEKKIIHRDLKSHNILVNKSFQVKVADFGLSHVRELQAKGSTSGSGGEDGGVVHKGPRHYGIFGTPEWMAPEVMEGSIYTEKIDVYSFGVLLSELVTRQMPFHDQFKIAGYMDVVDAVLDQGAIPTIPNWCSSLLGELIRACVNRNPADRPNFTDIILKLREVAELDDSTYFFGFDLPRLRELMRSSNPGIQSLAASEVAQLLTKPHIKRRSSPQDSENGSESGSSNGTAASSSSLPPPSGHTSRVSLGGLNSPLLSGRSGRIEGEDWLLDDDDATDFLERFTHLLSSSHRDVQLSSCRALRSLLRISNGDKAKRAMDRELVLSNGGLGSLITLLVSEQRSLSSVAGDVLLMLTEDLSEEERKSFSGLNVQGLSKLQTIILSDIEADERTRKEIEDRMRQKKGVLNVVEQCSQAMAASSTSPGGGAMSPGARRPKLANRRLPRQSSKFMGGNPLPLSPFVSAPADSASSDDDDEEEDEDGAGAVSPSGLPPIPIEAQTNGKPPATLNVASPSNATTTGTPSTASTSPSNATSEPSTPAMQQLFSTLQDLLRHGDELPEKFTEWYCNVVQHSFMLRYELEGDSWHVCLSILLPDELRVFNGLEDEPDEPVYILRTKQPNPDADDPPMIAAKVRTGTKHGMPFCFQIEDCGSIFTFCAGNAEVQEKWRAAITGKPKGAPTPSATRTIAPGTIAASIAAASVHPANATSNPSIAPGAVQPVPADATVPVAGVVAVPVAGHAPDAALVSSMPHLDLPTAPFTKRFRDRMTSHGYVLLRDRNTGSWMVRYMVLVGRNLRVYDSHRSSPNDPWAEHEIDPDLTNVNASSNSSAAAAGNNINGKKHEFFIRLHSSTVQFDCWAANEEDKNKWLAALSAGSNHIGLLSSSSPSSSSSPLASYIASFSSYYGHLDYYGWLYRKRKRTNRWQREFVLLVDSEMHWYTAPTAQVDAPKGTLYIATYSGKAFEVKQSSKRPHCLGIVNPSRTYYLAAETERSYLGWVNAIHQNQKRLSSRTRARTMTTLQPTMRG